MEVGIDQYPYNMLSNFYPHRFDIDGIACSSMEGFLQSLKFKDRETQIRVCSLVGVSAKRMGKAGNSWKTTQTLWWNNTPYERRGEPYQRLLDRAFLFLSTNETFKKALLETGSEPLEHTMGSVFEEQTVLTRREFISRLEDLRTKLFNSNIVMKKNEFPLKVKFEFEGTVIVRANSIEEAIQDATDNFGAVLGTPHTTSEDVIDWDIQTHPTNKTIEE